MKGRVQSEVEAYKETLGALQYEEWISVGNWSTRTAFVAVSPLV